ncbi:MAG TPA: PIN domain-containing protein [Thermoanaerobaculia bacterium]|nr:PIN domain-containing protein [Thermoanaerobaculia bacterium]
MTSAWHLALSTSLSAIPPAPGRSGPTPQALPAAAATLATLLPFGAAEARAAARIRAGLEAQGRTIGPYDILIAATALARGEVLVTHNTEELGRVEGLRLEDWF